VRRALRLAFDVLEHSHADILAACRETDLVVVPAQSAAGMIEADLAGVWQSRVSCMPWGIPHQYPDRLYRKRTLLGTKAPGMQAVVLHLVISLILDSVRNRRSDHRFTESNHA
jgi:hypothetical protein